MLRSLPGLQGLFLVGGGTGGHLTPGLALLEMALERFPDLKVVFFRTHRPIEDRVLASSNLPVEMRELELPPPGRTPLTWARFLARCAAAEAVIRSDIHRAQPDALVALGGYPALPGILAARGEGVPLVILEQNRVPGKVVRFCRRWAHAIACRDEVSASLIGREFRGRALIAPTGNPLRQSVLLASESRRHRRAPGIQEVESRTPRRTVLVAGGSQGARGINRAIRHALPSLRRFRQKIFWVHVSGHADKEIMVESYRKEGMHARVYDYTPDLPALLGGADLAITRAGGTIVSELAAIGVPAILVPYPHHRDRQQYHNAGALVEAGAAWLIPEESLRQETISRILDEVLFDESRLLAMEEAALTVSRPEATGAVLDLILQITGEVGMAGDSGGTGGR